MTTYIWLLAALLTISVVLNFVQQRALKEMVWRCKEIIAAADEALDLLVEARMREEQEAAQ